MVGGVTFTLGGRRQAIVKPSELDQLLPSHNLGPEGSREHLRMVQPETVLRWHRKGWRLYKTWKSRTRLADPVSARN